MTRQTLRLVLMISCAHAMVHVFELSLPAVEELIASEYRVGTDATGLMGNLWRFPFGLGALAAGWFVDRYGAKWMLTIYLIGCSASCVAAWLSPQAVNLPLLFCVMFSMGTFASIYHPAGLALISHEAPRHLRARALGIHGVFGSAGIAAAPFIAGLVLSWLTWRQFYLVLSIPGFLLGLMIATMLTEHHRQSASTDDQQNGNAEPDDDNGNWRAFFILAASGAIFGFIYAALMNFLPRYLGDLPLRDNINAWLGSDGTFGGMQDKAFRNFAAGGVLLIGMLGQYISGRIAQPGKQERQLGWVIVTTAPFFVAMAFAEGNWRLVAAAIVSLVLFMQQPLYNSLIADFVPPRRRSLGYGFSNMMSFGIGSFGAWFAGSVLENAQQGRAIAYSSLAVLALAGGGIAFYLARRRTAMAAKVIES
ncbi:MAG: MFS transporter [Pirellulales bacterium]|nr:MFS transporter [Pirellulales bacterium]